ncbi:polysaccharide biosynthesis C-terminal domain-containing protein [Lactiplantibacillus plantarum]|uniref:polysaccharide biosynthesis C-terminal domain-containing protein n=1 Tax=Lactiplantibacillus plantarum TaxID=1590 RepID=UPI003D69A909
MQEKNIYRLLHSLAIIAWAILFSLFSWIFSDCVLLPAKREKYLLKNTIITAIFNILINLIFIPLWSYDGAALSTVLAEVMSVTMNAYYGRDILKRTFSNRSNLKNIFDSLVGCIVVVIICYVVNSNIDSYIIGLIISVSLAIVAYFSVLLLMKNLAFKEFIRAVSNVLQRRRSRS